MKNAFLVLLTLFVFSPATGVAQDAAAKEIVSKAWDYMRGNTSISLLHMTVHRADWKRRSTIKAWTKGRDDSIFHITDPAKDRGNGTLQLGNEMWTYNPKINRVVKIPPSMMSQAWMGSDFSNNDLSKADSIIDDYTHEITETGEQEGFKVYTIKAIPKIDAPVVWGMQLLKIREDGIIMEQSFHDEDLEPVKILSTDKNINMGGRLFPSLWTMRSMDAESPEDYTLLEYEELVFDVELKDSLFTLNSLKKPLR